VIMIKADTKYAGTPVALGRLAGDARQ